MLLNSPTSSLCEMTPSFTTRKQNSDSSRRRTVGQFRLLPSGASLCRTTGESWTTWWWWTALTWVKAEKTHRILDSSKKTSCVLKLWIQLMNQTVCNFICSFLPAALIISAVHQTTNDPKPQSKRLIYSSTVRVLCRTEQQSEVDLRNSNIFWLLCTAWTTLIRLEF